MLDKWQDGTTVYTCCLHLSWTFLFWILPPVLEGSKEQTLAESFQVEFIFQKRLNAGNMGEFAQHCHSKWWLSNKVHKMSTTFKLEYWSGGPSQDI